MKRCTRKLLLLLSGRMGAILVSAAALWAAVLITGYSGPMGYEMLAVITFIRVVYALLRNPKPVLTSRSIRKSVGRVVDDEIQIGIAFVAAAYALQWPAARTTTAFFLTANLILQVGTTFLFRLALRTLATNGKRSPDPHSEKQVIIVGTGSRAQAIVDSILDLPEMEVSINGFLDYHKTGLWRYRDIPLIGHPDLLGRIIATGQVDAVILAVEAEDVPRTRRLFATGEKMGVTVYFMPDVYQPGLAKAQPTYLNGTPALIYRTVPEGRWSLLAKSVVDRVGAAAGLILAAPIMLLSAVAIKIDSRGPVLFKQRRCGLNGKRFLLYKFRTMCNDAEKKKDDLKAFNVMSGPVFKAKDDPRVTRVGRVLRKWSIDEIPQFLNVLRGEMSLVGPRPPLPSEVVQYKPWQHRKLSVKPGVTCLWQINGRNNIDFNQWMRLDLQYIDNWSLWLDTKILAKTLPAVVRGTGAS